MDYEALIARLTDAKRVGALNPLKATFGPMADYPVAAVRRGAPAPPPPLPLVVAPTPPTPPPTPTPAPTPDPDEYPGQLRHEALMQGQGWPGAPPTPDSPVVMAPETLADAAKKEKGTDPVRVAATTPPPDHRETGPAAPPYYIRRPEFDPERLAEKAAYDAKIAAARSGSSVPSFTNDDLAIAARGRQAGYFGGGAPVARAPSPVAIGRGWGTPGPNDAAALAEMQARWDAQDQALAKAELQPLALAAERAKMEALAQDPLYAERAKALIERRQKEFESGLREREAGTRAQAEATARTGAEQARVARIREALQAETALKAAIAEEKAKLQAMPGWQNLAPEAQNDRLAKVDQAYEEDLDKVQAAIAAERLAGNLRDYERENEMKNPLLNLR